MHGFCKPHPAITPPNRQCNSAVNNTAKIQCCPELAATWRPESRWYPILSLMASRDPSKQMGVTWLPQLPSLHNPGLAPFPCQCQWTCMLLPVPGEGDGRPISGLPQGPGHQGRRGAEGALASTSCSAQKIQLQMWPTHLLSRREHKGEEGELWDAHCMGSSSGPTAARAVT